MSPDNKEPKTPGQVPRLHWAGPPPPDEGLHPLSYEKEPKTPGQVPRLHWEGPPPDEGSHPLSYEYEEAEEVNSDQTGISPEANGGTGSRFESPKKFGLKISFIIIPPLLFGGITFLFLQSLMRSGQFYLHADRLWPVGLMIIAAMVLQGMLLYYAGTNNSFWILGNIAGFLLFLLVGFFALFGPLITLILLIVLLIASIIAARFATHPVAEGSVDILYASGGYSRTLKPGPNFMLPWEKVAGHLNTKERIWTCPEQRAPISRDEDVHLKATISYQLIEEDANLAITQVDNWEESLQELFKAKIQSTVAYLTPDDFLAWPDRSRLSQGSTSGMRLSNPENEARWEHINLLLKDQMQNVIASWGVLMNWVHIRDITPTPRDFVQINTDPYITMGAATPPVTPSPPVQNQAQATLLNAASSSAGKATMPPVVGNQAPLVVNKPAAEPPPPTAPRTKRPNEEVLKNAYQQIQNGLITSPEAIRSIAAGFQAIGDDPEASKNASFDATRAAQTLYERANLIEAQAAAPPPVSARQAPPNDVPTQSGWAYRTPSDDNMLAGG